MSDASAEAAAADGASARDRHIGRESIVSAAINGAISAGFFMLVFHGVSPVPFWGSGGLVADAAPQSFMVALMATLVPGLLTRRPSVRGAFADKAPPAVATIVRAAISNAALVAGLGVALAAAVAIVLPALPEFAHAFVAKVAYGAVLGGVVTRMALQRLLARAGVVSIRT